MQCFHCSDDVQTLKWVPDLVTRFLWAFCCAVLTAVRPDGAGNSGSAVLPMAGAGRTGMCGGCCCSLPLWVDELSSLDKLSFIYSGYILHASTHRAREK